jgi:hypothetical protein
MHRDYYWTHLKSMEMNLQFTQGLMDLSHPLCKLSIMPATDEYVPPIKHMTPIAIIVEQSITWKWVAFLPRIVR